MPERSHLLQHDDTIRAVALSIGYDGAIAPSQYDSTCPTKELEAWIGEMGATYPHATIYLYNGSSRNTADQDVSKSMCYKNGSCVLALAVLESRLKERLYRNSRGMLEFNSCKIFHIH